MSTTGERLREAREALKLTQDEVAMRAKVRQSTIANVENGLRKTPRELLAIAAAVNLSAEYLKTGKGPKHPAQTLYVGGASERERAGGVSLTLHEPGAPGLESALPPVLTALAGLTPGQWAMVRSRLDSLIGHAEATDDVCNDVLPLLNAAPGKRYGRA